MKLNIIGTGGVSPIPRPTCECAICNEARIKGVPYERTTCAMYVYDSNLLFDLGEDIKYQLNKRNIKKVDHVIITHRHPDHTHGIRILEQMNRDFENSRPFGKPINVYISKRQKKLFERFSCGGFLDFYEKRGIISLTYFDHLDKITINNVTITPYYIEKPEAYYFTLTEKDKKIVYAMCEYEELEVYDEIAPVDLFIAHCVFRENDSISPRKIPPKNEDTFEKMLRDSEMLGTKNILLTHIEESFQLSHDQLNEKMKKHYPKYNVMAAHDGMIVTV